MESAVISGMAKVAADKGSAMTLLLGDNFYMDGVTSTKRFDKGFEEAFPTSTPAFQNMPFYAVAGNHDHSGDVSVQIDYHQKGSGRWNFPDYDHTVDQVLPDGKTLRICMFDSVKNTGMSHRFENGTLQVAEGPADLEVASVSWAKLESCMDSKADYLFTAAHYPVWSGCEHGSVMKGTKLPDLIRHYGAQGHFAGHDHCLEHIEHDGILQIVAGAASYGWSKFGSQNGEVWHLGSDNKGLFGPKGGFAELSIGSSGAQINFYDNKANLLHSTGTLEPRTFQELV